MNQSTSNQPIWQRPIQRWLLIILAFVLYGIYRSSVNVLFEIGNERPVNWASAVGSEMWSWLLWLVFLPAILTFAKRFPLEKPFFTRRLFCHLGMMAFVSLVHIYLWKGLEIAFREQVSFFRLLADGLHPLLMLTGLLNNFYKYAAIVGVYYLFDYFRKYRQREKETAQLKVGAEQLRRRLTQAKLDALTMQLNPHFLFNALNTIAVLMEEDLERANNMLVQLSELLRNTLQLGQQTLIPLQTELDLVGNYLEIEHIRFEDRLEIHFEDDISHQGVEVPPLILQPLAENAIRHGIAKQVGKGVIRIKSYFQNDQVLLEVFDNGPGWQHEPHPDGTGIGLKNVRARLQEMYGDKGSLSLTASGEGTLALIRLPRRQEVSP